MPLIILFICILLTSHLDIRHNNFNTVLDTDTRIILNLTLHVTNNSFKLSLIYVSTLPINILHHIV